MTKGDSFNKGMRLVGNQHRGQPRLPVYKQVSSIPPDSSRGRDNKVGMRGLRRPH